MTTNPPPAAGAAPEPSTADAPPNAEFFDQIRATGVVRPDEGRWAAGVAAGLARRWGVDPLLVRGLIVAAVLFTGIGAVFYGVAWLLFQQQDGRIHAQEVLRGKVSAGFFGAVVVILADLPGPVTPWGWEGEFGPLGFGLFSGGLFLVGVAVAVWWFATRGPGSRTTPAVSQAAPPPGATASAAVPYGTPSGATTVPLAGPGEPEATAATAATAGSAPAAWSGYGSREPGRPPVPVTPLPSVPDHEAPLHGLTRAVLGLALVVFGAVLVWDRSTPEPGVHLSVAFALALAVVAVGVLVAGALGRRPGGLAPIAVLLAVLAIGTQALQGAGAWGSHVTWQPESVESAQAGYEMGVGQAVLDLADTPPTDIRLAAESAGVPIPVRIGVGTLTVVIPDDASVSVRSSVGLGSIQDEVGSSTGWLSTAKGERDVSGPGSESSIVVGNGSTRYAVDARLGVGTIRLVSKQEALR